MQVLFEIRSLIIDQKIKTVLGSNVTSNAVMEQSDIFK